MSTFDGRIVGAGGIPWWSPSQVLAINYRVCSVSCVCVCALVCLVFVIAVLHGNEAIFLPVTTADIIGHS